MQITHAIGRFPGAKLVVVGDVMLDVTVHGTAERISPEAPVPVLRKRGTDYALGGAGNLLANVVALGARCWLFAEVGGDDAGRRLRGLVRRQIGDRAHISRGPATTLKERFVADGRQLLRCDWETPRHRRHGPDEVLLDVLARTLQQADALVISDYAKGFVTDRLVGFLMAAARRSDRPVVVDSKGRDCGVFRGARLLTPNAEELARATGMPVDDNECVERAARWLIRDVECEAVLATLGPRGMMLVQKSHPSLHLPAARRLLADVCGAGDSVTAVMAVASAIGLELSDAASLANAAAGLVVAKPGTAVVSREELCQAVDPSRSRILDPDRLKKRTDAWRDAGFSIGLTNGCFDLLHPGHLSLLRQAKAACDRLIVAVNSDASIRSLKGMPRPVQNEVARSSVLAALACVDAVVVFDRVAPIDLIRDVRPDVLIKGADYARERIAGADVVEARGGRVLIVDLEPGYSTSDTLKKLCEVA